MRRFIRLSLTAAAAGLAALAVGVPASAASAAAKPAHVHSMAKLNPSREARPGGGARPTSNLTYHGGPVQQGTSVYLVFWGSWWNSTVTTGTSGSLSFTNTMAQTYVKDFFGNVGGSNWIGTDTQYCQGVAIGTVNCGSGGSHVTNPTGQLKGWTVDTSAVPANRSMQDSDIAAAAVRSLSVFGYHADATYMVFTPSGHQESGFAANGGQWCAWHSDTSSSSGTVAYANIPYMPDAGASCGENFINSSDSFGHGYFDGFSVVAGHEYEEAQTDPQLNAWYDRNGSENADKCAWSSLSGDTTLANGRFYAVQPVWSNLNNGCVGVPAS